MLWFNAWYCCKVKWRCVIWQFCEKNVKEFPIYLCCVVCCELFFGNDFRVPKILSAWIIWIKWSSVFLPMIYVLEYVTRLAVSTSVTLQFTSCLFSATGNSKNSYRVLHPQEDKTHTFILLWKRIQEICHLLSLLWTDNYIFNVKNLDK